MATVCESALDCSAALPKVDAWRDSFEDDGVPSYDVVVVVTADDDDVSVEAWASSGLPASYGATGMALR